MDLDRMSPPPATALDPVLGSVLIALARIGVDSLLISTHAETMIEANRRFTCFADALRSIRTLTPDAYVIAIGAADEHAALSLQDNDAGIELCAAPRSRSNTRERMVDREAVRDFLWWVIEARCTYPAWAPPLERLFTN